MFINKYIQIDEFGKYTITSGLPEFGYEMISILPFAYYLYEKNLLKKTISGIDTRALYYFSPDHQEIEGKRSFENFIEMDKQKFPNINIHEKINFDYFKPPKLKSFYENKKILFEKPSFIIYNRYGNEWGNEPINFIKKESILEISELLKNEFSIVLIQNSDFPQAYEDHLKNLQYGLNEKECSENGIISFKEIIENYKDSSINEIQCRLYAGCDKFVSSNGGGGIFVSYFGGDNIIMSKNCRELDPEINSFYNWYQKLGNSNIHVVNSDNGLIELVKSKYVNKDIFFNILVRTNSRPNYYNDCIKSIINQKYCNYKIITSVDDGNSYKYAKKYPTEIVEIKKRCTKGMKPENDEEYGIFFPYNTYFNELQKNVHSGYVIYLDDDDAFADEYALAKLNSIIANTGSEVVYWRVKFPDRIVPNDDNWEKKIPVVKDIDTIGFCFAAINMPFWEPWKRGDYRAAKYLFESSDKVTWHNEILTKLQREKEDGYGKKDDKISVESSRISQLYIIVPVLDTDCNFDTFLLNLYNQVRINTTINIKVLVAINDISGRYEQYQNYVRLYNTHFDFYYSRQCVPKGILLNQALNKFIWQDALIYIMSDSTLLFPENINIALENFNKYINKNDKSITYFNDVILPEHFLKYLSQNNRCIANDNTVIMNMRQGMYGNVIVYLLSLLINNRIDYHYLELINKCLKMVYIKNNCYCKMSDIYNAYNKVNRNLFISYQDIKYIGGFSTNSPYIIDELFERGSDVGISINCIDFPVNINVIKASFFNEYCHGVSDFNMRLDKRKLNQTEADIKPLRKIL